MLRYSIYVMLIISFINCTPDKEEEIISDQIGNEIYFPPSNSDLWENIDPEDLNWNIPAINALDDFMEETSSRAILILRNGKLVVEKYAGNGLLGGEFTQHSFWYWASAGKTLTAGLVGIAEQEGYLDIQKSSNTYLDKGWSSLVNSKEDRIKVRHHLTMTTGLEFEGVDVDCTLPECLIFRAEPGTVWFYHNAPYTLLDKVITGATGMDFNTYFNEKLRNPIGMDGYWTYLDFNHVYFSTARAMARYGLLILNQGIWQNTPIINTRYTNDMTHPSQEINKSYGYLWWLNGQPSHILPGLVFELSGPVTPAAPSDAFAGIGKNGQILYIVPSEQLIVVRMGENPNNTLVPTTFVNELWGKINLILND